MRWRLFGTLVTTLAITLVAGCGDDNPGTGPGGPGADITIPASWGGTWQITSTLTAARAGVSDTSIDQLCAGISVQELFDGLLDDLGVPIDLACTGSWNDSRADVTCTASGTVETCAFTATLRLDVTRTGDSFVGTQSITLTAGSPCDTTETLSVDVLGERLETDQFGCGDNLAYETPNEWAGVWSVVYTPVRTRGGGTLVCPSAPPGELFFPGNFEVSTTGGFDGIDAEVFASWNEAGELCTELVTHRVRVQMNQDGQSFSGTSRENRYFVGGGTCVGGTESDFTVTGTRTSTDISACGRRPLPAGDDFGLASLDPSTFRLF